MKKSCKKLLVFIISITLMLCAMMLIGTSIYFVLENTIGTADNHIGMIMFPLMMALLLSFIIIDIINSIKTESYIKPWKKKKTDNVEKELDKLMAEYKTEQLQDQGVTWESLCDEEK